MYFSQNYTQTTEPKSFTHNFGQEHDRCYEL